MKKHNAAISIFLIIITLSSVMLGGLFIDFTRILVAKNKVRTAAESALRSSLAGYSENLVSEWGLFGILQDDAEEDYKKYFKLNLTTDSDSSGANVLKYEIVDDKVRLTLSKPLSDSDVFSEKITEYEKYRAPVSMTLGVIDKFKAIFGDNNELSSLDVTGITKDLTNRMKNTFSKLKTNISTSFSKIVNGSGVTADTSSSNGNMQTINTSNFSTLTNNINSDIDNSKSVINDYSSSLSDYEDAGNTGDAQSDSIAGSVSTDNASGDITEDESLTIDSGIKTYENTPDIDDDLQSEMDDETALLNETQQQAEDSAAKTNDLKSKMQQLVNDAKSKAEVYNSKANYYNTKYNQLAAKVAEVGNGVTVSAVLKYDTEEKINNAQKDINKKYTERTTLENDIKELNTKINALGTDLNTAISQAETLESSMRSEYTAINKKINYNKDWDDDDIRNEITGNKSTYKYINEYYKVYFADSSNSEKSMSDFITSFYNTKISEANANTTKLKGYKTSLNEKTTKLNNINAEINGTEFKVKETAVKNKTLVLEVIKAKKDAQDYYSNTYKPALDAVSAVNSQDELGIDSINDYTTEAYKLTGDSGSDGSEDDTFSLADLLSFGETVKNLATDVNKTLPTYSGDSGDDLDSSFNIIDTFNNALEYFQSLGELITNKDKILDKIYLVDYIMSKCSYITSQTSRKHYFNRAEAEYIIYGQSSQGANIVCAVGSVAFLRFAINSINYFITSKNAEIITRIGTALVRGLAQTVIDMETMLIDTGNGTDKGLIAVCPSLSDYKVLSYSDHLRILLLLKMKDDGGAGALRRCIHATMEDVYGENIAEVSSSNNLSEYYTQATATAAADVDLYFIPLFIPDAVNYGVINDGKYRINVTAVYGY